MDMKSQLQVKENNIEPWKLVAIAADHKKEIATIITGCTILAAGISYVIPKQYESTTLVQTRTAGKDIGSAATMAAMMGVSFGGTNASASLNSYIELMKSRNVLDPVIDSLEWADGKKPTAQNFAKSNLKIENKKQTNLITVTATGKTPEEAQMISQGVVDNFLILQTNMNKQTQSLLVKFLDERVATAKQESEEAAAKLAEYSKENKMYAPDEQAKLAIEQLNAYDKSISEMEVEQKSAQATYDTATARLREQKAGAKNYHVNDNSTVQNIRAQIVEAQVELVSVREKYTEEHPSVIQAKKKLDSLNQALINEVNAAVDSRAATLNTAYAELLKNQAVAEAQISAASASEVAIKEKRNAKEKELGDIPDIIMNYTSLSTDAKVKREIYLNLVKEREQDKIQEAMESMDIQVIDPANLPDKDKPKSPVKKMIAAIGLLIGSIISIVYTLCLYKRNN